MNQLNLLKTDPKSINMDALKKEIPGTVAIILDMSGKLQGVDQKGNPVAVVPAQAEQAPAPAAPAIDAEMEESIITKVGDNVNDGLSKMLKEQEEKNSAAQEKALEKATGDIEKAYKKELESASKAFTDQLGKLQAEINKLKGKTAAKPKSKKK